MKPSRCWVASQLLFIFSVAVLFSGCSTATPVGVTSLGRNYAYDQIDRSALNSKEYSSDTANVLHRYALEKLYHKSPEKGIAKLHELALTDNRRDTLFALSELSFLVGRKDRSITVDGRKLGPENFFAASAIYAYLYLLGPGEEPPPTAFDRRFRQACDLYNRSLGYIIARREGRGHSGVIEWPLPVGSILVHRVSSASDFTIPLEEDENFISADRFQIRGFSVRNRIPGLGSPVVILSVKKNKAGIASDSSATVFFRVEGGLSDMTKGTLNGTVEVYSAFTRNTVEVDGQNIPLEKDLTTQIAYALNNPFYWNMENALFKLGQTPFPPGIYPSQPYKVGKIPVVFVHGTDSSPVWWAEMWNTLMGDPTIRNRYQFWFFLYDSAKPIYLSANQLRASLLSTIHTMDPEGKDPALQQIVVIGHSQGGLLAKLITTNTGDTIVKAVTGKTIAELNLSPDEEKLVRQNAVFEAMPQVKRVIFISTPHRGSYLASGFVRSMARYFLKLPKQALESSGEMLKLTPKLGPNVKLASTSLDGMSPDNVALLALAEIPVSPPIIAHSIIPIDSDAMPPAGEDGVVKYTSEHIDYAVSELVVRSGHSCQDKPQTIEEVRRILLLHLQSLPAN